MNRLNFRLASGLIGWSRWTARSFIDRYGAAPERVHVVPPGVDTDVRRPVPRAPSTLPRILFVGGQFARKGGAELLKALTVLGLADCSELNPVTRDKVQVIGRRLGEKLVEELYLASERPEPTTHDAIRRVRSDRDPGLRRQVELLATLAQAADRSELVRTLRILVPDSHDTRSRRARIFQRPKHPY